jgi:hypothetical protein
MSCEVMVNAGDTLTIGMSGFPDGAEIQNARVFFDLKNVTVPAVALMN